MPQSDHEQRPQLTEQTAKRWKLVQLVGVAIGGVGAAVAVYVTFAGQAIDSRPAMPWLIVVGVGLTIWGIGSGLAWWHHG